MRPARMLCVHNPPHSIGDCWRTALAIVLNLEPADVPHFMDVPDDTPSEDIYRRADAWLIARGLHRFEIAWGGTLPIQTVLSYMANSCKQPGLAYILSGRSPRGEFNHSVVAMDGKIVCDPYDGDAKPDPIAALCGPQHYPDDPPAWGATLVGRFQPS